MALYLLLSTLIFAQKIIGQQDISRAQINQLLVAEQPQKADSLLAIRLNYLQKEKKLDSLVYYISIQGYVSEAILDLNKSVEDAKILFDKIFVELDNPLLKKTAYLQLSEVYDNANNDKLAFDTTLKALEQAKRISDPTKQDLNKIYHNLGIQATYMGNLEDSKKYLLLALQAVESQKNPSVESLFDSYNAMGILMWNQALLDSSYLYFQKALTALNKNQDGTPLNTYYRPAMLKSNMAVLQQAEGKTQEAIDLSTEVIKNYTKYIKIGDDVTRKRTAIRLLGSSMDNLAVFYNGIGHFHKADGILAKAFAFKQKNLEKTDSNLMISQILMAQSKMSLQEFDKAQKLLEHALAWMYENNANQPYWEVSAKITLASVHQKLGNTQLADQYYTQSFALQKDVFGDTYNRDFLLESYRMAKFFAQNNKPKRALQIIQDTHDYINKTQKEDSPLHINQLLAMAEVYYALGDFTKAEAYSLKGLKKINNQQAYNPIDSIYSTFNKPSLILLNVKSKYAQSVDKNGLFLKQLITDLNTGLAALERRKALLTDTESLGALLEENEELINFTKKIELELYQKTENKSHLDRVLSLHESALYSRIRSRLSIHNKSFAGVPDSLIYRERLLKEELNSVINEETTDFTSFFESQKQWNLFVENLKSNYKEYYDLKYANLTEELTINRNIENDNRTIIRYFYIDKLLYAVVIDRNKTHLIPLDIDINQTFITQPSVFITQNKGYSKLYDLYKALWAPIAPYIHNKRVTIVPDASLFNISFESLLKKPITDEEDIVANSLIQDYVFSYQYSLLLKNSPSTNNLSQEITAFAPIFSPQVKKMYKQELKDSLTVDQDYLTLLSQPFAGDLAKELKQTLGARVFLNEKATKSNFIKNSKNNLVLHIGTHASSNNLRPELSQLVFAKSNFADENHILYAHEIYQDSIQSKLTVLTACETGKPSYQPGEGMISLAHAFNYAGSESLLTSLWQIDEASSTEILKNFYQSIDAGKPKDVALHEAKLVYLKKAQGRMRQAEYWAGLVIMGNLEPIVVSNSNYFYLIVVVLFALLLLGIILFRKFRKREGKEF